ncbi:MAG TPA: OST-HTH/LOTUS domain-containing protein [Acidimicrobiia bacterium]|nr:OST-HTH/LOTUS domain-containing protein [Acidimicrobiia bacterium]
MADFFVFRRLARSETVMSMDASTKFQLADMPPLITAAFDLARERGKPDWNRMTAAVLKNRLLQLTNRQFDERLLGFATFSDFLANFPSIVRLDHTTMPITAEFLGKSRSHRTTTPGIRIRVRSDLWDAALNYTAGHRWFWDRETRRARPMQDGDEPNLAMPTFTSDELSALRRQFAETSELLDPGDRARLEQWQLHGLGTAALPINQWGPWNETLRSAVIERLTNWFAEQGVETPRDLTSTETLPVVQQTTDELSILRSLVLDCIRAMTLSELASLSLPAGVVVRAQANRARSRFDT